MARMLSVDGKLNGEELLILVRERIESGPRWLIFLDNADDLRLFGVGETSDKSQMLTSLFDYIQLGDTIFTRANPRHSRARLFPKGIAVALEVFLGPTDLAA
ncbi:Fc.00g000090.m01.CDS01 [Cosmosporella sp. VM-42]